MHETPQPPRHPRGHSRAQRRAALAVIAAACLLSGGALAAPRFVFVELADPPVAVRLAAERAAGRDLSGTEQKEWVARLTARQAALEPALVTLGADVVWRYQRVLNGLQVRVPEGTVSRLLELDGVVAVRPVLEVRPTIEHTVPFIGAAALAADLGLDGSGIDIGVVDSGVDYLHQAFGGPGTAAAYQANDPTTIADTHGGAPLFPTPKVVGGTDFVGEDYDAQQYDMPAPDPDPMPSYNKLDPETGEITAYDEHGTHVAATAAGVAFGEAAPGVAPGARVWALKVFGQGSTTLVTAAVEWASDPNGDGDLSDALDVLNLSLGSQYGGKAEVTADQLALDAFVDLGGVVVAAAGNEGNIPFIHAAPAVYPTVISVANTYGPGEVGTFVVVEEPEGLAGSFPARQASKQFAPQLAAVGPLTGGLVYAGEGCAKADFPNEVEGAIALVDRGDCTFATKLANAASAGAIGAVVVNNEAGEPIAMSGSPASKIPAVMLWKETGEVIRAAVVGGATVVVTVGAGLPNPLLADAMSWSSSRGPGLAAEGVIAKPDVAAPGTHIRAARAGTGDKLRSKTGTSMASPHVAGLAALLRQAHPDWSPRDIKARLVTTAAPAWVLESPATLAKGPDAPASWAGAGRVDAVAATSGGLIAVGGPSVAVDLGHLAPVGPTTVSRTVQVHNRGSETVTLTATFAWRGAPKAGATVAVEPSVTVEPGTTGTLAVTVALDPTELTPWGLGNRTADAVHVHEAAALGGVEIAGAVVLEGGGELLHVPVYGLVRPSAAVQVTDACLSPGGPKLSLTNVGVVEGWTEQFTLLAEDKDEPALEDSADLRAVGARWTDGSLQLALVTWGLRLHPARAGVQIYLDTTLDGVADFLLAVRFDDWQYGTTATGRPVGVLFALAPGKDPALVGQKFVISDLLTSRLVLTVPLPWLGLSEPGDVRLWVVSASAEGGVDLVPDTLNLTWLGSQQAPLVFGGPCAEWRAEPRGFAVAGPLSVKLGTPPTCADGSAGLLLLHEGAPGLGEADVIHAPSVDVSGLCAKQVSVPIPAGECVAPLALEALGAGTAAVGECALDVAPEALEPTSVGPGKTDVVVRFRDDLGRTHQCTSAVVGVPEELPRVECPVAEPLVRGELPWTGPVEVACGAAVEIAGVECVGAQDVATGCEVWLDGGLRVTYIEEGATEVRVRLVATDSAGQQAEVVCSLPVAVVAEVKPDPPGPSDAGASPDLGSGSAAPDAQAPANTEDATQEEPPQASSSGCGSTPGPSTPWLALAAGLAILGRARRRVTGTCDRTR